MLGVVVALEQVLRQDQCMYEPNLSSLEALGLNSPSPLSSLRFHSMTSLLFCFIFRLGQFTFLPQVKNRD